MKPTHLLLLPVLLAAPALSAGDQVDPHEVPGLLFEFTTEDSNTVESPVAPGTKIHWHSLVRLKILKRETSPEAHLFGRVISNNTGMASERIPIFFGSDVHGPRLADHTDEAGQFRFTVRLSEEPSSADLRASTLEKGKIYLDGLPGTNGSPVGGLARVYSLNEIMTHQGTRE